GRRADRLRLLRERAAVGGRGCADAAPAGVRAELRAPVPERMVLERRVLPGARRAEAAMTTSDRDLGYRPATELAGLARARKTSPVELTDALLRRIEQVNPALNAFCTMTPDLARAAARRAEEQVMKGGPLGPLHGLPFTIKDLALTAGVRTMGGSRIFERRVTDTDAPFVRRLKDAGGVMVGKTTTPEFGWKALGDSPLTGITRNPWNPG